VQEDASRNPGAGAREHGRGRDGVAAERLLQPAVAITRPPASGEEAEEEPAEDDP
jgi:hypothetical protein